MMSDLMLEEFEAWARKRSMDLEYRNFPGVGKFYECPWTLLALDAWRASRECLVIDLPKPYAWDNDGGFEREHDAESECSMALIPKIDAMQAIHAAGVKTK